MKAVAQSSFIFSYRNKPHPYIGDNQRDGPVLEQCWVKQGGDFATEGKGRKQKRDPGLAQSLSPVGLFHHMTFWSHLSSVGHPDELWVSSDSSFLCAPGPAEACRLGFCRSSQAADFSSQPAALIPGPRRRCSHTVTKLPHALLRNLQLRDCCD